MSILRFMAGREKTDDNNNFISVKINTRSRFHKRFFFFFFLFFFFPAH